MNKEEDKKTILQNLKNIKENVEQNYDIICSLDDFPNYIKLGETKKEKIQILIMLYVINVTLEELKTWDFEKIKNYIYDNEKDYYNFIGTEKEKAESDKIFNECFKIIEGV